MIYPTLEEVKKAELDQICKWYRFLPSPGMNYINEGTNKFDVKLEEESKIMIRIGERLKELGGFTPEISKRIGWKP